VRDRDSLVKRMRGTTRQRRTPRSRVDLALGSRLELAAGAHLRAVACGDLDGLTR
jgi:hypothetical protein